MNFKNSNSHPYGKVVYYIPQDKISIENSKDKRDGKDKAIQYCLDNFIDPNTIIKFDSRIERDRYEYLHNLQEKGEINRLTHHFIFRVLGGFKNANNDEISEITYESDFTYTDTKTGQIIVEDVKGSEFFIDDKFSMIKKIFDYFMKDRNIYLKIIMLKNKEWVEWKMGDEKKSSKLIKKQREIIHQLKQEQHDRIIKDNKEKREKERIKQLQAKEKLTKRERERLEELLKKYDSIVWWNGKKRFIK